MFTSQALHCLVLCRRARGFAVDEAAVVAALCPLENLGDAPDGEGMRETGRDDVSPEAVERLLVVVLLEVAGLRETLIVVPARGERAAAELHHRAPDHVFVLCDKECRAVARQLGGARPRKERCADPARQRPPSA